MAFSCFNKLPDDNTEKSRPLECRRKFEVLSFLLR
jgi:hypothetical protein